MTVVKVLTISVMIVVKTTGMPNVWEGIRYVIICK